MRITYDPLKQYRNVKPGRLKEACAFIWMQSAQAAALGIGLKEVINEHYGYPTYEFKGGTVDPDGTYRAPEDPPLYPLCEINTGEEMVYMYEHEIISIRDRLTGNTYVTRVD